MVNTVTCPACGLKHLARPDGACPRCRTRLAPAGPSPAVVVTRPPLQPQPPPPPAAAAPPAWDHAPPAPERPEVAAPISEPSLTLPLEISDAQARLAASGFRWLALSFAAGIVLSVLAGWWVVKLPPVTDGVALAVVLGALLIVAGWIMGIVSSYRLAQGIGGTVLWLGVLVPGLVGFIFAWMLLSRAVAVFRSWGVPVGPLGPRLPPASA